MVRPLAVCMCLLAGQDMIAPHVPERSHGASLAVACLAQHPCLATSGVADQQRLSAGRHLVVQVRVMVMATWPAKQTEREMMVDPVAVSAALTRALVALVKFSLSSFLDLVTGCAALSLIRRSRG